MADTTIKNPCVTRFQDRATAQYFAQLNGAKVERCPQVGTNRSGFFKYQVITDGVGKWK
jgi:hypothetical protein